MTADLVAFTLEFAALGVAAIALGSGIAHVMMRGRS